MENKITVYECYEKQSNSQYNRRLIDGKITGCGKCVGYCDYREHSGFLTKEQRKQHNCLGRQCRHYIPKEKSETSSQKRAEIIKLEEERDSEYLFRAARNIIAGLDYMKIVRVVNIDSNCWYLDYVSISNDNYHMTLKKKIEDETGLSVEFRRLNWPFERCAEYLLSCN